MFRCKRNERKTTAIFFYFFCFCFQTNQLTGRKCNLKQHTNNILSVILSLCLFLAPVVRFSSAFWRLITEIPLNRCKHVLHTQTHEHHKKKNKNKPNERQCFQTTNLNLWYRLLSKISKTKKKC